MPTNQSNRSQERLAIDGGTPIITRELNRYKGAAAIGEEEKRAVLALHSSSARNTRWLRAVAPVRCVWDWLASGSARATR